MNDDYVTTKEYAGFGIRLMAFFIDKLIGLLVLAVVTFIASVSIEDLSGLLSWLIFYIAFFAFWHVLLCYFVYLPFFTSRFGGSIGKLVTGLRIVKKDGTFLGFWESLFRFTVGYTISALLLYLGFLWIIRDDQSKQGWHDQLIGSYVIKTDTSKVPYLVVVAVVSLLIGINTLVFSFAITNFAENTELKEHFKTTSIILKQTVENVKVKNRQFMQPQSSIYPAMPKAQDPSSIGVN